MTLALATLAALVGAGSDTLHGSVVDTAGRPLAGAAITVAELSVTAIAAADGRFRFVGLPGGRYTVVVRRVGFVPAIQAATVPGSPVAIVLRPTVLQLDAITVTATRAAIDPLTSPLPSAELAGERLQRQPEVSLAHAVDGLPGGRVLSTGEQVGKPIIRGLTGPRVLVLDNGQRLEDYSWSDEDGPSVDPRLAERVELIRGPASVMYGSDAMGGVINVVPNELPDGRGRRGFARAVAALYGATNNAEAGTVLRAEGASGRFAWRVTGIGRRADNFHTPPGNDSTPTGELYNTAFHAITGELMAGVRGDHGTVALRYTRYGGDFGLLDGPPVPSDNVNGPLRRLADDRLQLTSNTLVGGMRLETKSQWQRHALQEVSDQSRNADSTPTFDLRLNTFSTDVLVHQVPRAWLRGTVGVAALYQDNATRGVAPLVPAARLSGGAVFAFETATLGRWTLLGGARADVRHLTADANVTLQLAAQTRDASALTGDLGAAYRVSDGLAIAANLGRAFRAPTLFELFSNGPHLGEDRYEIGLPGAEPETSVNADLSLRWQGARVRAELAAYRNWIDHYLYLAPTGQQTAPPASLPIYRYQQAAALVVGAEAGAELAATPFLTLRARADAVRGTNRATTAPLPLMPPPRGAVEVELHGTGLAWAERAYVGVGEEIATRQTRLGPFDTQTPAYHVLDVSAGVEQRLAGRPIHVDVRVRNAANARYTDFLSRYKLFAFGEGRNVVLRVSSGL